MLIAYAEHVEAALNVCREVEVAHAFEQRGEQFVALSDSRSESIVISIEVAEQTLYVVFARLTYGTLLNSLEIISKCSVSLCVFGCSVSNIDEKLRWKNIKTLGVDD